MKLLIVFLLGCVAAVGQSTIGVGRGTGSVAVAVPPLSIVRSAKATGNVVSSLAVTLGATPTVGDTLVIFMSLNATATTPTTPTGTWTHVAGTSSSHARMDVWTHRVVSGDGTTYTFTSPTGGDYISLVAYEIAGANATTPVNQQSVVSAGTGTTFTTPSLTPSAVGTLALSAITENTVPATTTATSGWSVDQAALPAYHGTVTASRTALTTNTTTAISDTFTLSSSTECVAATVLLGS